MVEAHLVWPITKQYLIWLIWFDNHDCHYFDQQQPKLESETCLSPDPNRLTTLNLTRVFQKFTKKKIPLGRLYSITISHVSWQFVNHAHVFLSNGSFFSVKFSRKKIQHVEDGPWGGVAGRQTWVSKNLSVPYVGRPKWWSWLEGIHRIWDGIEDVGCFFLMRVFVLNDGR